MVINFPQEMFIVDAVSFTVITWHSCYYVNWCLDTFVKVNIIKSDWGFELGFWTRMTWQGKNELLTLSHNVDAIGIGFAGKSKGGNFAMWAPIRIHNFVAHHQSFATLLFRRVTSDFALYAVKGATRKVLTSKVLLLESSKSPFRYL